MASGWVDGYYLEDQKETSWGTGVGQHLPQLIALILKQKQASIWGSMTLEAKMLGP